VYINQRYLFICSFDFSRMLFSILLSISSILLVIANEETSNTLNILMPDAVASHVCIEFSYELIEDYITSIG
jgi:hypothetical protein